MHHNVFKLNDGRSLVQLLLEKGEAVTITPKTEKAQSKVPLESGVHPFNFPKNS